MKRLPLIAILLLGGCDLYFGGHGGDDKCEALPSGGIASIDLRDPSTGECGYYNEPGGCDDACGPCAETPPVHFEYPSCTGSCDALDESDCLAAAGCHAQYDASTGFATCWDIEPLTPIEGGDCTALDPYTCAQHDDCSTTLANGTFASCNAEGDVADACDTVDCGPDSHCEAQCFPDPTTGGDGCYAMCVTDSTTGPGTCTGSITCNAAPPACPDSTTPGLADGCYTGYCIPLTDCGPTDPGSCFSTGGAMCGLAPPACPANTTPGITNGCWSGFCIPLTACN